MPAYCGSRFSRRSCSRPSWRPSTSCWPGLPTDPADLPAGLLSPIVAAISSAAGPRERRAGGHHAGALAGLVEPGRGQRADHRRRGGSHRAGGSDPLVVRAVREPDRSIRADPRSGATSVRRRSCGAGRPDRRVVADVAGLGRGGPRNLDRAPERVGGCCRSRCVASRGTGTSGVAPGRGARDRRCSLHPGPGEPSSVSPPRLGRNRTERAGSHSVARRDTGRARGRRARLTSCHADLSFDPAGPRRAGSPAVGLRPICGSGHAGGAVAASVGRSLPSSSWASSCFPAFWPSRAAAPSPWRPRSQARPRSLSHRAAFDRQ